MGHAVPDRLFWAHEDDEDGDPSEDRDGEASDSRLDSGDFPLDTTKH
jgi:hydroxymethylpyrimidine/phosphomethylpyrimidine kinase